MELQTMTNAANPLLNHLPLEVRGLIINQLTQTEALTFRLVCKQLAVEVLQLFNDFSLVLNPEKITMPKLFDLRIRNLKWSSKGSILRTESAPAEQLQFCYPHLVKMIEITEPISAGAYKTLFSTPLPNLENLSLSFECTEKFHLTYNQAFMPELAACSKLEALDLSCREICGAENPECARVRSQCKLPSESSPSPWLDFSFPGLVAVRVHKCVHRWEATGYKDAALDFVRRHSTTLDAIQLGIDEYGVTEGEAFNSDWHTGENSGAGVRDDMTPLTEADLATLRGMNQLRNLIISMVSSVSEMKSVWLRLLEPQIELDTLIWNWLHPDDPTQGREEIRLSLFTTPLCNCAHSLTMVVIRFKFFDSCNPPIIITGNGDGTFDLGIFRSASNLRILRLCHEFEPEVDDEGIILTGAGQLPESLIALEIDAFHVTTVDWQAVIRQCTNLKELNINCSSQASFGVTMELLCGHMTQLQKLENLAIPWFNLSSSGDSEKLTRIRSLLVAENRARESGVNDEAIELYGDVHEQLKKIRLI